MARWSGSARVGLPDVQGAPVLLPEGRGDALLALEDAPEAGPALPLSGLSETPADGLHQLVGDDGDKEVPLGPFRGRVEAGTQAGLGLERAKHRLHVGKGAVGAPQCLLVPAPDVGAQAAGAGMGEQGACERPALPGEGAGLVAVAGDLDVVVRANAAASYP